MKRRLADPTQPDLFDSRRAFVIPRAPEPVAGSLAWDAQLRGAISAALKESQHSREIVAARMSELLGETVTKARLDSWTAESKEGHRFPLSHLPAFEAACETHAITRLLASKRGCSLLVGEETIDAEVGKLERRERAVKLELKTLKALKASARRGRL